MLTFLLGNKQKGADQMKMTNEKLEIAKIILADKLENVQNKRTNVPTPVKEYPDFLLNIYRGNHKTYKYILLTALLAKVSFQNDIDPLSIQEGDGSRVGSFDARSLAHKVVVPFERKYLNNALGGSNEPYLNKPARFPTISKTNAVRAGQDKEKLDSLVDNLKDISVLQANEWLEDSINILLDIAKENEMKFESSIELKNNFSSIKSFFLELTKQNFGGEILALSIGGLLSIILDGSYSIEVHKVNQSGASSKEVGDIDVFLEKRIVYSFEAKSKNFTLQDAQHAIYKAQSAKLQTFFFIYNQTEITSELEKEIEEYGDSIGVVVSILSFENFLPVILSLSDETKFDLLPNNLLSFASNMQLSDSALTYVKSILEKFSK